MILIIVSLVLAVITIGILGADFNSGEWKIRSRMLLGLFWLLIIPFGCFSTVKTGEIGIKTRFGKVVGMTKNEGFIYKSPFEKITKINIKVQKYENKDVLTTSTKDIQIVNNIKVSINYQIEGTKILDLYKKVGKDYKNTILEPAIQETIKSVISKYTSEELVTKRSDISLDINNTLNNRINSYGINSVSVAINNFDFSESYNQAIEQKAVAEQNVLQAQQELEKEKIEAEKKLVKAEAEQTANQLKQQTLTDNIIKEKFIEKWNGELPKASGSNFIMNIDEFLK